MIVGEMLDRMSSSEMTEWRAYYELEASEQKEANQRAQNRSKMQQRSRGR